jgi:hypothetical protein
LNSAVIGAGAAIAGGLLTGAYKHARDWWERPILQIDYLGSGANRIESGDDIFIRARVRNNGKQLAKNCVVYLTALTEENLSVQLPTVFHDAMPLAWPIWAFRPRDIPKGADFYVNVLKISKETKGWFLCVEQTYASHEKLKTYKGTYRFRLLATADGAVPAICDIEITYNQDWNTLRAAQVK